MSFGWLMLVTGCGGAAKAGGVTPKAVTPPGFWEHWGDGRAEVDTYRLTTPRYGQLREGRAVLVFVTEDFTDGARVKSDGGHDDVYPVLKLNEMRHFQTGIYDYSVMTSTFLRIDGRAPIGQPVKVSFSAQEWCGHVYAQLLPRTEGLALTSHSYFDGEADQASTIPLPTDAVLFDALPILARGLVGEWPAAGTDLRVPVLPTLMWSRFAHEPLEWTQTKLSRGTATTRIEVPAGSFEVVEVTSTLLSNLVTTWQIEVAYPHRIVRWTNSEGETAELVASERLPYWTLNHEGDESHLAALGLAPSPVPTTAPAEGSTP